MQMLGGWLDQALPGQRWIIIGARGPVQAVSGIRDVHVVPAEDRNKPFSRDQLFLDLGAQHGRRSGGAWASSPAIRWFRIRASRVLNGGSRYVGKAFDDRVGCAVLIEAFRRLAAEGHPNQLFVAATTQEEIGLRGAHTAAEVIRPDIGIAIEGGVAGDQPVHPSR